MPSHFNPAELRDTRGRWTSAFKVIAHRLDMEAHSDGGPDRNRMPQLSGLPLPGSKADKMFPGRAPGTEVDLTSEFKDWLGRKGIGVIDTEVPSSVLKPTQDEISEPKVIGLAKFMQHAPKDSPVFEPIFVTSDNHVIDGHHRWAANEVRNEVEHVPRWMKTRQVQTTDADALRLATEFMDEYGLPRVGVNDNTVVSTFAKIKADLSRYTLKDIDLTRYVRTPEGAEWYHLPIGSPIPGGGGREAKASVAKAAVAASRWPRNPKFITLNQQKMTLTEAASVVSDAYDWENRDREGRGRNSDAGASIMEQNKAQILAKSFFSSTTGASPLDQQYAASTWSAYQSASTYGDVQNILRNDPVIEGVDNHLVRQSVTDLFKYGGYTTEQPITVFRALKSDSIDWAEKLKPGTTFKDTGIVSTTAHSRFAEGWLGGDAQQANPRPPKANDVVMEIRLPGGSRVVGGDPGFVETMLPPGSSFKVLSSTPGTEARAVSPLTHKKSQFRYTHVVVEAVPS